MSDMTLLPQWEQIRDAIGVNEEQLLSAWLSGSFVNPAKSVTEESDIDIILAFKEYDATEQFSYDGRNPATVTVGGINRPVDIVVGGPTADFDDGLSIRLYHHLAE
jgi:hypothetical protein